MRTLLLLTALADWFVLAGVSLGQGPPDYGLTWRTVGDPGNPAASPSDYIYLQGAPPVGQVNYTYRLTQTEVTYGQWLEFVDAYSRVNPNVQIDDPAFRSLQVHYSSPDPNNHGWYVTPGAENAPALMGWFYSARYVNWLQNGKAMNAAAFESGVYDMSSFHQISGATWVGQTSRAPGAQFWIPSWSEWDKGMHWDPHKFGPGQGGYWLFPNSSDSVPVGGLPGTLGAQTSAGDYPGRPWYLPVGSYPDQQSPWGLLDGSGGVVEYLDGWDSIVWTRGARAGDPDNNLSDRLDIIDLSFPITPFGGLRIAAVVPACGSADFDGDSDLGTDADIEAFFACLAGNCCPSCGSADFNGDGDLGTDADIESFFRILAGGPC